MDTDCSISSGSSRAQLFLHDTAFPSSLCWGELELPHRDKFLPLNWLVFSLDVDADPCSGDVEHREVLLMMLI